jgi:signal transduction histidine kinase/CheY-like chemotaxis protein
MSVAAVRSEQVRTLYDQSGPVLLTNVVNAALVSAILWRAGPRPLLLGWTLLMALMAALRLELRRRYRRAAPPPEEAGRWGGRFAIGSAAAGLLWGGAGALFFDVDGFLSEVLITFAVGGMGAAAAGTLSCHLPAFWAYLIPSVVPLAVRLVLLEDRVHLAMAAMVGIYVVGLAVVARTTNRAVTQAFRLGFEKEELLAELTRTQHTLEESNRRLEQRVAERTAQLAEQGESLRQAQRMEAVGRLAGGVAHDFNNLLTVVLANAGLLGRDRVLGEMAQAALDDIRAAAVRGADLVRQLLTFSRRQKLPPRVIDLNGLVANMDRLLGPLVGEVIEMRVTLVPGPALIRADPSQLEQVLVNLVTNARDAMPRGGLLTIGTDFVVAEGDPTLPAGPYVVLSVGDTGVGMNPETRHRLFEPFFTTKPLGQGTGLGLATVYGIVDQGHGRITVRSQPGEGTTFTIYLPRVEHPDPAEEVPPPPTAAPPSGARVLLAEDDADVRGVTAQILRVAGYDVITAADGLEALALARASTRPIDVLVADLVMSRLGGLELARLLSAERPTLRVLFISGYGLEGSEPVADAGLVIDFLQKPLSVEALTGKIAGLLATPPAPPAQRSESAHEG